MECGILYPNWFRLARISSTIEAVKENVKSLITESKIQDNKIHEQDLLWATIEREPKVTGMAPCKWL